MKLPNIPKKAHGVAILTVMVSLALMMAIVTELSSKELVRYKLAMGDLQALQAEALAQSGANFAQIILTVQEPLQGYLSNFAKMGVSLPAYTVWELMPIDSDLLKGITDGSFLPDFGLSKDKKETADEEKKKTLIADNKAKNVPLTGPYEAPEGGYGGFRGRFSTEIEDEEKKISLRRWAKHEPPKQKMIADQIFRVLSKPENSILFDGSTGDNKNIGPSQLIGNIYDYISEDDRSVDVNAPKERFGRDMAGDKRVYYSDMPGISPKKAPMDSTAELRLVPGMTDAIFQVLSKVITIYGESDKINILSASDDVLASLFFVCAKNRESGQFQQPAFASDLVQEWNRKKNEGSLQISAEGLISHLEESGVIVDKEECEKSIGTESKTFTVKSTATVGTVTKTLLLRLRSVSGLITLYQYQYL
jgi:hypothetical protein